MVSCGYDQVGGHGVSAVATAEIGRRNKKRVAVQVSRYHMIMMLFVTNQSEWRISGKAKELGVWRQAAGAGTLSVRGAFESGGFMTGWLADDALPAPFPPLCSACQSLRPWPTHPPPPPAPPGACLP
jgi:hypothetical protein